MVGDAYKPPNWYDEFGIDKNKELLARAVIRYNSDHYQTMYLLRIKIAKKQVNKSGKKSKVEETSFKGAVWSPGSALHFGPPDGCTHGITELSEEDAQWTITGNDESYFVTEALFGTGVTVRDAGAFGQVAWLHTRVPDRLWKSLIKRLWIAFRSDDLCGREQQMALKLENDLSPTIRHLRFTKAKMPILAKAMVAANAKWKVKFREDEEWHVLFLYQEDANDPKWLTWDETPARWQYEASIWEIHHWSSLSPFATEDGRILITFTRTFPSISEEAMAKYSKSLRVRLLGQVGRTDNVEKVVDENPLFPKRGKSRRPPPFASVPPTA